MARKFFTKLDRYDYDMRFDPDDNLVAVILDGISGGDLASITSDFNYNEGRIYVDSHKAILDRYETIPRGINLFNLIIYLEEV